MSNNIKPILTVYLAGRIAGATSAEATDWRNCGLQKLKQNGLIGVCPIAHGQELNAAKDKSNPDRHKDIVKIDCELIWRSDAMIVNLDAPSFGTAQEIFYASQCLQIPVLAFNNKSTDSSFMYATVHSIVGSIEECIEDIVALNEKLSPPQEFNKDYDGIIKIHDYIKSEYFVLPQYRLTPRFQ